MDVVIKDFKRCTPKATLARLDLPVPPDAASDMVVATRPNAIRLTSGTRALDPCGKKGSFLTDETEYLVSVGEQLVRWKRPPCGVCAG